MQGVLLNLLHPTVASRECADCLFHVYNEETGAREEDRKGEPLKRTRATPPPCQTDKGCPKGTPEQSRSLTPENLRCWMHYRECKAVGQFPEDPVVRRNAAIIREAEEAANRRERRNFETTLVQLMLTVSRFGMTK